MALDRLGANALASDSVTTAKIAADAVTSAKIPADAVVAADIADGSITTAKIAAGAVTNEKTAGVGGGGKNVIVNSEMVVSQRATSFASVGNVYTLDRFAFYKQNSGAAFTVTQNSVTDLPGFSKSLKVDCTTADTSLASNEQAYISHKLEGKQLQRFAKGHGSDALPMTLSFYVKTNKTGLYTVTIFDRDNTRKVNGSYTVANANWARHTITFPADASGKLDNDNNSSLELFFNLYAGADTNTGTLSETWAASVDAGSTTGQVNFADNTSNDWEITGIQLETGSTATPFEHRILDDHMALCRRYYIKQSNPYYLTQYGVNAICNIPFPVQMRSQPAMAKVGGATVVSFGGTSYTNPDGGGHEYAYSYVGSSTGDGHTGYTADAEL